MITLPTEVRTRITLAELDAQSVDTLPARELMGGYGCGCHLITLRLCLSLGIL